MFFSYLFFYFFSKKNITCTAWEIDDEMLQGDIVYSIYRHFLVATIAVIIHSMFKIVEIIYCCNKELLKFSCLFFFFYFYFLFSGMSVCLLVTEANFHFPHLGAIIKVAGRDTTW